MIVGKTTAMRLGAAVLAFFGVLAYAAADDNVSTVSESRAIDGRVIKVRLDGIINLKLRQGTQPSLIIRGEQRYVTRVTTTQSGNTLVIETEMHSNKSVNGRTLQAELVLPSLRELSSDGFGSSEVTGFSGEKLDLALDGAGMFKITADYKMVNASLGGVGSMTLQMDQCDRVDLNLGGAGVITLIGRSHVLKASLGGLGGLSAQRFIADTVDLELSGLGNATVYAKQSANLNLSGLGSVTVYGKPLNRNVSVDGLGKVSWK